MRNWGFYLANRECSLWRCLAGGGLRSRPAMRSAFRRTPRPRDRRLSERHCLANVDNRDNIDVVPEVELRDKRGDDLRVVGLDQAVAGGPREVLHKSLDTQALLLLWLPLAEGGQECFRAR